MKKDIDKYDWELDEKTQNIYDNLLLLGNLLLFPPT